MEVLTSTECVALVHVFLLELDQLHVELADELHVVMALMVSFLQYARCTMKPLIITRLIRPKNSDL